MTMSTPTVPQVVPARGKRFFIVLTLAFITYSLAYLDRVNIGFGETGGMSKSLGISANQFAWFNAFFFFGYVLFQIPGAGYAARYSVKKLMFGALILWGIIASVTGLLHNYPALLFARFLLGAVEGLVFPSLLVFLTHWFTKSERSRANTLLILGNPITMLWASLVCSGLIQYFKYHPLFGLQAWQLMLICEGLPTLAWAGLWWLMADDRPADASWLTTGQAAQVQGALDAEQRDVKQVRNYWAAFRDPQVILLCLQFLAWSIGIYGLNMWLPVIVQQGSKMGIGNVGLLTAIPYASGIIAMITVSAISDRLLIRKHFVWPFMLLGAAAFMLSYLAGPAHFWLAFLGLIVAGLCMYAPYGPFWAMVPEMVSRNVVGESMALINTLGAVGGFFGTLGVGYLRSLTGSYTASFLCLSLSLAAAGVLTLLVRVRADEPDRGFEVITLAERAS